MADNIYIDTNVFIDIFDVTRPYASGSVAYIREAIQNDKQLHINSDTVSNAYYVLSKVFKRDRSTLAAKLKETLQLFEIVEASKRDVASALDLCLMSDTKYTDYEDALQYICAQKIDAEVVVTNDRRFVSREIPVIRTEGHSFLP